VITVIFSPMAPRPLQVPANSDLLLGAVCTDKSTPGSTRWQMTADERFANPAGTMQGGMLCAFIDTAMGSAAVTFAAGRKVRIANAELKVSFLAPVLEGAEITCEAAVVSGGGRVAFAEASVTGADGTLIARASSTYLFTERT
jgi:uncharacterized protein (TIGR00369 family)